MPRGVPNKRHTGEFKQMVVETMMRDKLSYREVAHQFEISGHEQIRKWERIYLMEGPEEVCWHTMLKCRDFVNEKELRISAEFSKKVIAVKVLSGSATLPKKPCKIKGF